MSSQCRELRQIYRWVRFERWLPGFAAMSGLYGASIPVHLPEPSLDREWCEYLKRSQLVEEV
ncbi:hypothetical protein [Jatrophihabitans sp.]|uniref:hypothetical protein n=1 Tax=Jatrophihabitans sp. TaxID=1932789 RepID=UPI0030C70A55|nr:hypothetical protein [Jatrophihabitans sp.]